MAKPILQWFLVAVMLGLAVCTQRATAGVLAMSPIVPSKVTSNPFLRILLAPRGGDATATPAVVLAAEETLRRHLETTTKEGKFLVQGWRWHTMSLLREAERLHGLALRLEHASQDVEEEAPNPLQVLQKAADYVVGFNLGALHRVEGMFFPWVRKKTIQYNNDVNNASSEVNKAFETVMDHLEQDQRRISELGNSITQTLASSPASSQAIANKLDPSAVSNVAQLVAKQSAGMATIARNMLELETSVVIPTVGRVVPESDQKKFNNHIITVLGVFDARCHLVHMHEVVALSKSAHEEQLWKESIPSLPRSLIPRWKRTLYEPKASVLDQ